MKHAEVKNALDGTGLPVTYLQWKIGDVPPLPYICYYYPAMDPEAADNVTFASQYQLNVELYTKNKDFETEALVDEALTAAGMVYTKAESYLNDERMYEVLYIMEVLIDG